MKNGGLMLRRSLVSAHQCRAARAILQWSQSELARRAGVARKTVADFEKETRRLQVRTRRDIARALEGAGVRFDSDEGGRATAVQFRTSTEQPAGSASSP